MTIQRMDNVLIVVEDLEAATAFFGELGMELEGRTQVEVLCALAAWRELRAAAKKRVPSVKRDVADRDRHQGRGG